MENNNNLHKNQIMKNGLGFVDSLFNELNKEINKGFPRRMNEFRQKALIRQEEVDNKLKLYIDLPGLNKEEIKLSFDNRNLIVETEKSEKNENRSSYFGFKSSYYIPENFDLNKVNAEYLNGTLNITIDKNKDNSKQIKIN